MSNLQQIKDEVARLMSPSEYILKVYGIKTFARSIDLNDAESIMDLMSDYAKAYSIACQEQLRRDCAERATCSLMEYHEFFFQVDKQSILETPLIK